MIPRSAFLASVVCIAFAAASASSSSSSSVAIPADSTAATVSATTSVVSSFASPPIILRLSTSHTRIPSSHYHHDHGSMTRRKGAASSYFGYLRPKTTTATVHRRNNCINNNSIRSKKSAPTTITALQMALTEEFVQMKINGDVSSSTSLFTDGSSSMDTNFGEVGNDDGGSSSWDGRILNMEDSRGKSATEEPTTTTTGTTTLAAPASSSVPPPTSSARRGNHPTRAVPTKQRGNTGRESSSNSNNNSNDVLRTKFLQPFLSGRMALSTVQSLARVAGAGSGDMGKLFNANNNGDDDVDVNAYPTTSSSSRRRNRNINDDTRYRDDNKDTIEDDNDANDNSNNMDGFNKGAFGIANVLSHRRGGVSSNSRTQVIQWQRESLRNGRREVWDRASSSSSSTTTTSSMSSTVGGKTKSDDVRKIDEYNSRMTPLVGILQKSANDRSRNKSTTTNNNNNKQQQDQTTITAALKTIENDMAILDVLASLQPQLSGTEVGLLLGAIVVSGVGPIFFPGTSVTEVLAPAAAACECTFSL